MWAGKILSQELQTNFLFNKLWIKANGFFFILYSFQAVQPKYEINIAFCFTEGNSRRILIKTPTFRDNLCREEKINVAQTSLNVRILAQSTLLYQFLEPCPKGDTNFSSVVHHGLIVKVSCKKKNSWVTQSGGQAAHRNESHQLYTLLPFTWSTDLCLQCHCADWVVLGPVYVILHKNWETREACVLGGGGWVCRISGEILMDCFAVLWHPKAT